MTFPLVSIVMITYNQASFIEQAIGGVFIQQYGGEIEFILVNDNSTDSTDEIIKKYFAENPAPQNIHVSYTTHKKNKGAVKNFFWSLEQAKGKYIAICEGDDYWTHPLKIKKQVAFLEKNPDYVICFHPIKILDTDGSLIDDYITVVPNDYHSHETLTRCGNYIHTPSVVFRNIITKFPTIYGISPIGDYLLYMSLSEHGKIMKLSDEMAIYRQGVGVISKMDSFKKACNNITMYSCMIATMQDEKTRTILISRQLEVIALYQKEIDQQRSNYLKNLPFKFYYNGVIRFLYSKIKKQIPFLRK